MTLAITPLATGFSYHPLSYTESPKDDGLNNSLTGFYRPVNHTGSPQDDGSNNSVSNWILSSCAVADVICTCCYTSELKVTLIFSWHSKCSCPYRQHEDSVIMQKEHTLTLGRRLSSLHRSYNRSLCHANLFQPRSNIYIKYDKVPACFGLEIFSSEFSPSRAL